MASNEVEEIFYREAYRSLRGRGVADTFKQAVLTTTLIVATSAVLVLVVISPLALRQFSSIRGANWTQLSNIGQTYGAASALLTALALIGVAGSMIFQVRAIEISRAESVRGQHTHLMEMAMADPVFMQAWGHDPQTYGGSDRFRQLLYVNLIVSFWEAQYKIGGIRDDILRGNLAVLFRGDAGREFWAYGRYPRLQVPHSRRHRRFSQIVDEEYQKAITAGPATVPVKESPMTLPTNNRLRLRNSAMKGGATLLIGAIGGIAFETRLRQRKR